MAFLHCSPLTACQRKSPSKYSLRAFQINADFNKHTTFKTKVNAKNEGDSGDELVIAREGHTVTRDSLLFCSLLTESKLILTINLASEMCQWNACWRILRSAFRSRFQQLCSRNGILLSCCSPSFAFSGYDFLGPSLRVGDPRHPAQRLKITGS